MSYRPLIAVVAYHLADDRVPRWPDGGYGVPAPYLEALRRAGARTAIIAPGEEGEPASSSRSTASYWWAAAALPFHLRSHPTPSTSTASNATGCVRDRAGARRRPTSHALRLPSADP